MSKKDFVMISGASSGIGLELSKVFAKNGFNLLLISRTEHALALLRNEIEAEHHTDVRIFAYDLQNIENIEYIFRILKNENISPRILINNAGFANYGEFMNVNIQKQMELIDLNVKSLTFMTWMFLNQLNDTEGARILNVSSMAGLLPGPYIPVYAASKSYVYSFSQAIASELKPKGVAVSVLCPADVRTGFQKTAGIESSKLRMMEPKELAVIAYKEFMNGKRLIIPKMKLRLLKCLLKCLPEKAVADSLYNARKQLKK
ncbi:MAG: SDR family NAD(P)-dependent oxidoreductase [Spirochaetales bacterium]|nr:SDR family NAD(P)-dependent oxidoreductase [Spirochaetales bacterium]